MLRYAAEFKDLDEPLRDFIKRRGGINECACRFGAPLNLLPNFGAKLDRVPIGSASDVLFV